jgi:hypothetical protein
MSIAEIYGHYDLTTLKARRWFSRRKPKAPEAQGYFDPEGAQSTLTA